MHDAARALTAHFNDLRTSLLSMRDLLGQEAEQLTLRDAEGLDQTSRAKARLSVRLDQLTASQDALLASFELPPGKEGLATLLAVLPGEFSVTAWLRDQWREIRHIGEECQRLNELNGAYIGLLGKHVERSLDLLHGRDAQEFVYGPDGGNHKPRASRTLVSV